MSIRGTEGLSGQDIKRLISEGAEFVVFQYNISFLITVPLNSPVFFFKKGEDRAPHAKKYILFSALLGWLGIPGIFTNISKIKACMRGGKNVTQQILPETKSPTLQLKG